MTTSGSSSMYLVSSDHVVKERVLVGNTKYVRQYSSDTGEVDWFIPTTNWKFKLRSVENASELEQMYTEMMQKITAP
jgi:hypothetical protein